MTGVPLGVAAFMLCGVVPCLGLTVLAPADWEHERELPRWTEGRRWEHMLEASSPLPPGQPFLDVDPASLAALDDSRWAGPIRKEPGSLFAGNWRTEPPADPLESRSARDPAEADGHSAPARRRLWFDAPLADAIKPATTFGEKNPYLVSFANWGDWAFPGASEESYLSDLAAADWIGMARVGGARDGNRGPAVTDFAIPEPGQIVMLTVALALGAVELLRRRRKTGTTGSRA